jgi:hypothetical protein
MKTPSIQRPRPAIEILMPAPRKRPVKAALVNCAPLVIPSTCVCLEDKLEER